MTKPPYTDAEFEVVHDPRNAGHLVRWQSKSWEFSPLLFIRIILFSLMGFAFIGTLLMGLLGGLEPRAEPEKAKQAVIPEGAIAIPPVEPTPKYAADVR